MAKRRTTKPSPAIGKTVDQKLAKVAVSATQATLGIKSEASSTDKFIFQRLLELEKRFEEHATETQKALVSIEQKLTDLDEKLTSHSHAYVKNVTGGGGNMWFDLRDLKRYIDDDDTKFDNWGVILRGGSVPAGKKAPQYDTGKAKW